MDGPRPSPTSSGTSGKDNSSKKAYKQKVFYKAGLWSSTSADGALSARLLARKKERDIESGKKQGVGKDSVGPGTLRSTKQNRPAFGKSGSVSALAATALRTSTPGKAPNIFPPLPVHWGVNLIYGETKEFRLPFDIMSEWEEGSLEGKKLPSKFIKLRRNVFVDRKPRYNSDWTAICHCEPDSGCGSNCINRAMNYLCGKQCPSGPGCTNGTLSNRPQKGYKLVWTGARGFGVQLTEDLKAGEFVMDYRGDVISMDTFYQRIRTVYAGRKDFYALEYDADEVIDSGIRGNDGRFINHSCDPNIEVRKYQTMGQGFEEYEVGFWTKRDVRAGEEIFYDYNFDSFTTIRRPKNHPDFESAPLERRQRCHCGAFNCSGWLGKATGEASVSPPQTEAATLMEDSEVMGDLQETEPGSMEVIQVAIPAAELDLYGGEAIGLSGIEPDVAHKALGRSVIGKCARELNAAQLAKRSQGWRQAIRTLKGFAWTARKSTRTGRLPVRTVLKCQLSRSKNAPEVVPGTLPSSSTQFRTTQDLAHARQEPKLSRRSQYGASWRSEAELNQQKRRRCRGDIWLEAQRVAMTKAPSPPTNRIAVATHAPETTPVVRNHVNNVLQPRRTGQDFMASFLDSRAQTMREARQQNIVVNTLTIETDNQIRACKARKDCSEGSDIITAWTPHTSPPSTSLFDRFLGALCSLGGSRLVADLTGILHNGCQRRHHHGLKGSERLLSYARGHAHKPNLVYFADGGEESYDTGEVPQGYQSEDQSGYQYEAPGDSGEQYEDEGDGAGEQGNAGAGSPGDGGDGGGDDDGDDPGDDPDDNDSDQESEDEDGGPNRKRRRSNDKGPALAPEEVDLDDLALPESDTLIPPFSKAPAAYDESLQPFVDLANSTMSGSLADHSLQDSIMQGGLHHKLPIPMFQSHAGSALLEPPFSPVYSHGEDAEILYGLDGNPEGLEQQATAPALKEKKRRKKWTLPLDDATIEAERRKKKKGRRWLLDMLEAAAKKRADMIAQGIPIPSPPPQLPELLPVLDHAPDGVAESLPEPVAEGTVPDQGLDEVAGGSLLIPDQGTAIDTDHVTLAAAYGDDMIEPDLGSELSEVDLEEMQADAGVLDDLQAMLLPPTEEVPLPLAEPIIPDVKVPKVKKARKVKAPKPEPTDELEPSEIKPVETKPRKPRPARRFKTPLTRVRPKLEAAVGDFSHLSQAEEEAALESERRRRKKGLAWVQAMKALAKAKRDAREKLAQGLKPDEFVLPPTSLPVSGRRKMKRNLETLAARAAEVVSGAFSGSVSSDSQNGGPSGVPGSTSSTLPEIPDFMYPPDHPSRQRTAKGPAAFASGNMFSSTSPSIPLPAFFEESLAAERLAAEKAEAAAAAAAAKDDPYRDTTLQAEVPALIDAVRTVEANLANGLLAGQGGRSGDSVMNGFTSHNHLFTGQPDYNGLPGFDLSALRDFTHQDESDADEVNGLTALSHGLEFAERDKRFASKQAGSPLAQSTQQTPALPTSTALTSKDVVVPSIGKSDVIGFGLPQRHRLRSPSVPVTILGQPLNGTPGGRKRSLSPSGSTHSESRKRRGPPVKKIAGSTEQPLTDEQWEMERKKRKKGHAWVTETKAAAEAERAAMQIRDYLPASSGTKRWNPQAFSGPHFGLPNVQPARYGSHQVQISQEEEDDRMLELAFGGPPRLRDNAGTTSRNNDRSSQADIIPYPSSRDPAESSPDIFSFNTGAGPYSPQNNGNFMMPPVHLSHLNPLGINSFGLPLMQDAFPNQQLGHEAGFS